jgi:putative flavoprotein involved in K+ transport
MSDSPQRAVVIGGGQAGLAVGYHLKRRGLPFVVLDENERVGDVWRRRWDSLRLFTPARYSGLPGMPFPGQPSSYPTKDEVAAYFDAYVREFDIPVRTGVRVVRVSKAAGGFKVECRDQTLLADSVVVATGAYDVPRVPTFASELDDGIVQLHSREYRKTVSAPERRRARRGSRQLRR